MNNTKKESIRLGILGKSLPHTLSPEIHTSLLNKLNISGTYEKIEMNEQEVVSVINFMDEQHITGINVTIPYKEVLYKMADVIDPHAAKIGAVNTILLKDHVSYGFNTDYLGVLSMFHKAGVSLSNKDVVLLGSGGAARALIYAFHLDGARSVTIAARNKNTSALLKEQFPYINLCTMDNIPSGDVIVNATPVGMFPSIDACPVSEDVIRKFHIAADIVYNPLFTKFLKTAENVGLQIITGLTMLVDQAIAAEEIWLDKKIDYTLGNAIYNELSTQFFHTL